MDNKIKALTKLPWYIQGINAVPVYLAAGPVSGIFHCRKTLGYGYTQFIMGFKEDYCELYYSRKDLHHMFDEFYKRYKRDEHYLKWLEEKSEEEKKPLYGYISGRLSCISGLSDEALVREYILFTQTFYGCFGASHLVEAIALTTDVVIKDLLLKDLQKVGKAKEFTKYFTLFNIKS